MELLAQRRDQLPHVMAVTSASRRPYACASHPQVRSALRSSTPPAVPPAVPSGSQQDLRGALHNSPDRGKGGRPREDNIAVALSS